MGKLLVQDDDDAAAVVNDQLFAGVKELPARSFTPVVIVAVYGVEAIKDDEGSNVAKLPFVSVTNPVIKVPAALFFSVNVLPVTVVLCTASLNVAVIEEPIATTVYQ